MPRRLEARGSIEVYNNDAGDVIIKQESFMGDDDAVVIMSPQDIPQIIRWLQECAADGIEIIEMKRAEELAEEKADVRETL